MGLDLVSRFPDLTRMQMPDALGRVPRPDWGRLARVAEDAAYVTVGFGVLGLQRLAVYRRELERSRRQG